MCVCNYSTTDTLLPCSQDSLIGSTVMYWTAARAPHLSLDSTCYYSAGEVMMNHAVVLAGRQRRTQPAFLDLRLTRAQLMGLHLPVNEPQSQLKTGWKQFENSWCTVPVGWIHAGINSSTNVLVHVETFFIFLRQVNKKIQVYTS